MKSDVINICFYRKEKFLYLCEMFIEIDIFKVFMEEFSEDFQLKELTNRCLHDTWKKIILPVKLMYTITDV